ncbi:hypothetical protein AOLI_G00111500 [Acnodon oligacanthus]
MSGLLYLICLFVIQCGHATGRFVLQLESTVRVEPGHSTSLECQAQLVEQTDVATYFCGMYSYGHLFFGNGSKLILEEHVDATVSPNTTMKDNEENHGKVLRYEYLMPALAVTNVASISFIIWLCCLLKKKQLGVKAEVFSASDNVASGKVKTDEINYAALTFGNKQRRTVQRRTSADTMVIYEAVQHQEES